MKKNYSVSVRVNFKIFYEDDGWCDNWSYENVTINDIERDEIEEYVNKHKPRPSYVDYDTQYMITGVEVKSIEEIPETTEE